MKCFAAVALMVAVSWVPACAQHGSSHGGGGGRAAVGSRGGFAASAPRGFSGGSSGRSTGYRAPVAGRAPGIARGYQRGVAARPAARSPYTGSWRYRRPYVSPYRVGIVPGYGWIGPYFPGFAYDDGYDDSSAAPDNSAQGYDVEAQPDQGLNQDPDQQGPPSQFLPAPQAAQPGPSGEEAVTLIFKNGRPPEQIYNYILTPTMLYVGGQHHQAIPTDQLDLAATARVNQDAGVDFQVPSALK